MFGQLARPQETLKKHLRYDRRETSPVLGMGDLRNQPGSLLLKWNTV